MKQNVLVTVCGRAGSKGFANKNIKTFLGQPLVYYTLAAAFLFKKQIGEVAVVDICLNTDSEELKAIVLDKYSEVEYIKRNPELAGDRVPKAAVWHNCIDVMQERRKKIYDYMIDLDITSPLRQAEDIYNAYQLKLKRIDADMVESVCDSRRNPYFNMLKEDGNYVSEVIHSEYVSRQQAPKVYDENASIYILNTGFFANNTTNMINMAKTVVYQMKDTAVLDIDSEEDFQMMEVIGEYLYKNVDGYRVVRDYIRK